MRSLVVLLVLSFTVPSFAHQQHRTTKRGWWKNFCETWLVADDPYQYDHVPTENLLKEYRRVGGLVYWTRDKHDQHFLDTLGYGLRKRLRLDKELTDEQEDAIIRALEDYPSGEQ